MGQINLVQPRNPALKGAVVKQWRGAETVSHAAVGELTLMPCQIEVTALISKGCAANGICNPSMETWGTDLYKCIHYSTNP